MFPGRRENPTPMDDGERRKALTIFASEGRRAQPPVFVGRDAVIEDISAAAELAYEKWSSGEHRRQGSRTYALGAGSPGSRQDRTASASAGALAGRPGTQTPDRGTCQRQCPGVAGGDAHAAAKANSDYRHGKMGEHLVDGLVDMAPGRGADALGPAAAVATKALRGKSGVRPRHRRGYGGRNPTGETRFRGGRHTAKPARRHVWRHPRAARVAGLGYLHSYLQQDGIKISRYSDDRRCVHTLGALKNSECLALLKEWLAHFGVVASPADLKRWGDALIRDTEGWPMHTSGFLAVLADDLAHSRDPANLASANLATARRVAAEDRAVYYNGRYEGLFRGRFDGSGERWLPWRSPAGIFSKKTQRPSSAARDRLKATPRRSSAHSLSGGLCSGRGRG